MSAQPEIRVTDDRTDLLGHPNFEKNLQFPSLSRNSWFDHFSLVMGFKDNIYISDILVTSGTVHDDTQPRLESKSAQESGPENSITSEGMQSKSKRPEEREKRGHFSD